MQKMTKKLPYCHHKCTHFLYALYWIFLFCFVLLTLNRQTSKALKTLYNYLVDSFINTILCYKLVNSEHTNVVMTGAD